MITAAYLQNAFGFLKELELPFLVRLAKELPDSPLILNIGAGVGTSAIGMMEARPDAHVVTIDIEGGINSNGGIGNLQHQLDKMSIDPSRYSYVVGDSMGIDWDRELDMLFVDGKHSYEYAKSDIEKFGQWVKKDGVIAVHDYDDGPWGCVVKAVDDTLPKDRFELIEVVQTIIAFRVL